MENSNKDLWDPEARKQCLRQWMKEEDKENKIAEIKRIDLNNLAKDKVVNSKEEINQENANKNPVIASTQRDYMAFVKNTFLAMSYGG